MYKIALLKIRGLNFPQLAALEQRPQPKGCAYAGKQDISGWYLIM